VQLLRSLPQLPPFLPCNICHVNSAAASAVDCGLLMLQCHQLVCACRARLTLPRAFRRLLASNKELRVHCKHLQRELLQTKDALSEEQASLDNQLRLQCRHLQRQLVQTKNALSQSRASLDERNEQMLQLHKKTSAARTE
jgi:septal ring factor EnvC (AmiA/AmiB activator)